MNEQNIWDFLYGKTKNAYGTAALMGNLMAESGLNPVCATGLKKTKYENVITYIADSDNGNHDFAHDGVAFGLVQWCYYSRKQGLLVFAIQKGGSISDLNIQLEFMWQELHGYRTVLNAILNAKSIREASDVIMLKYEKPADISETMKKRRADYGQKFYDQFAAVKTGDVTEAINKSEQTATTQSAGKKYVRTTSSVNARSGKSTKTDKLGVFLKGKDLEWIATENGWHKVAVWVSGDFSKVITK